MSVDLRVAQRTAPAQAPRRHGEYSARWCLTSATSTTANSSTPQLHGGGSAHFEVDHRMPTTSAQKQLADRPGTLCWFISHLSSLRIPFSFFLYPTHSPVYSLRLFVAANIRRADITCGPGSSCCLLPCISLPSCFLPISSHFLGWPFLFALLFRLIHFSCLVPPIHRQHPHPFKKKKPAPPTLFSLSFPLFHTLSLLCLTYEGATIGSKCCVAVGVWCM
ncbi:hypothetical protein K438DRAFT_226582 [Mycena galopus ATCC 62051]|nr:hypothetical protein K438DRAFT_226582 [Mycena galopus ATCC 62051]